MQYSLYVLILLWTIQLTEEFATNMCKTESGGGKRCCTNFRLVMGDCVECPRGTFGVDCAEPCPTGYYGLLCTEKCQCSVDKCMPDVGCASNLTQARGESSREQDDTMAIIKSKEFITTGVAILVGIPLLVFLIYRSVPEMSSGGRTQSMDSFDDPNYHDCNESQASHGSFSAQSKSLTFEAGDPFYSTIQSV